MHLPVGVGASILTSLVELEDKERWLGRERLLLREIEGGRAGPGTCELLS